MKQPLCFAAIAVFALFTVPSLLVAAPLLHPNDFIIPIDTDPLLSLSSYPDGEAPLFALDSDSSTKYLNFGKIETGLIVEPFIGSTVVKSIQLTTANDAEPRDPTGWKLYGTNDSVTSADNGAGSDENWTLIAESDVTLPAERMTLGPVQSFDNSTAYTAYRVLFPTVKDPAAANSMQIADVNLFTTTDGSGSSVWAFFDTAVAFQLPQFDSRSPGAEQVENLLDGNALTPSASSYPDAENPANAVDGTLAKYLNFGGPNSGFIVSPAFGPAQVQSFQLTTANDADTRDPTSWELYGTNDPIMSLDNSPGVAETWTLVDSGDITLPAERNTVAPVVSVSNGSSYSSYKMLFPTLNGSDRMQIAEASFFESSDGSGTDVLNPGDPVLAIDADVHLTKYLNFGRENSGFIVTPTSVPSVLTEFQITTANDSPSRDPASYELYGTNDSITSEANGHGDVENWVLISSGTLELPEDRDTLGDVIAVTNSTSYSSYKMLFPTIRDPEADDADSMQIAGIQFFDASVAANADFDGDGDVDGRDFAIWQSGFGMTGQSDNSNGDANGSGTVDSDDFAVWVTQFGTSPLATAAAVPEPTAVVLTMVGLVLMTNVRVRSARKVAGA